MKKKTILIIDDDLTALDIVDYLFDDEGFEVVRSTDGSSVIDSIDKVNPDIILIDLMMPVMSGQECVRQLRKKGVKVPILAFTAVDDPEVHQEAELAGCNLVVTKPCRPKQLVGYVRQYLDSNN
jgi:DNA-binding response OmpR family regulator